MSLQVFIADKLFFANGVTVFESGDKLIEKSRKFLKIEELSKSLKLSKSGKSKSEKLSKLKKLSKNRNLPKFAAKNVKMGFLTFDAKTAFNRLLLAFIKALIL